MARNGYKILYASKSIVLHDHHKKEKESFIAIADSLKRFLQMYPPYVIDMIFNNLTQRVSAFKKDYKDSYTKEFKKFSENS